MVKHGKVKAWVARRRNFERWEENEDEGEGDGESTRENEEYSENEEGGKSECKEGGTERDGMKMRR